MHAPLAPGPSSGDVGASFARWSLAVVLFWTGVMAFTAAGAASTGTLVAQNPLLSWSADLVAPRLLSGALGTVQVVVALLLFFGKRPGLRLRIGAAVSAGLSALSLTLLVTNPVWIDSLGGFPFIGSGQGLLKQLATLGVSVYLLGQSLPRENPRQGSCVRLGLHLTLAGLVLVLGWIGLMKFTAVEAAGIQPLLATSPAMSWMLAVFGTQGASNVIGMIELVTVALLSTWLFQPSVFRVGAILAAATFLATLSFILTLPGWDPDLGFPALSGTGIFLLRDLVLLAAVIILLVEAPGGDPVADATT